MYDVNWHYTNDVFSHCSVTPIKVIRESVLPGCTGVSITAKDSNGRKFQGSPDNYYATEEAAWAVVARRKTMSRALDVVTLTGYATNEGVSDGRTT
jgi:hypothetical protein